MKDVLPGTRHTHRATAVSTGSRHHRQSVTIGDGEVQVLSMQPDAYRAWIEFDRHAVRERREPNASAHFRRASGHSVAPQWPWFVSPP